MVQICSSVHAMNEFFRLVWGSSAGDTETDCVAEISSPSSPHDGDGPVSFSVDLRETDNRFSG